MCDGDVSSAAQLEILHNIVSEIVASANDPAGFRPGLRRLASRIARFSPILNPAHAGERDENAVYGSIVAALESDEFIRIYAQILCAHFDHLGRHFFIHIPKTGGNTVVDSMASDGRYALLRAPHFLEKEGTLNDRIETFAEAVRQLSAPATRFLTIIGHLRAREIIDQKLAREGDETFAIVRCPIKSAVSMLNYAIGLINAPSGTPLIDRDIWRAELRAALDLKEGESLDTPEKIRDRLDVIIASSIIPNQICDFLGVNASAASAADAIEALKINIVPIERMKDYLETRDIRIVADRNVSEKFIEFGDIPRRGKMKIYDIIGEDLKLHHFFETCGLRADRPWYDIHERASPSDCHSEESSDCLEMQNVVAATGSMDSETRGGELTASTASGSQGVQPGSS